jgi:hypothetical protein
MLQSVPLKAWGDEKIANDYHSAEDYHYVQFHSFTNPTNQQYTVKLDSNKLSNKPPKKSHRNFADLHFHRTSTQFSRLFPHPSDQFFQKLSPSATFPNPLPIRLIGTVLKIRAFKQKKSTSARTTEFFSGIANFSGFLVFCGVFLFTD